MGEWIRGDGPKSPAVYIFIMSITAQEYLAGFMQLTHLAGIRGLMAAVIAQATFDYVKGGQSKTFGDLSADAERFLESDDCRFMVETLGWQYKWPWPPLAEISDL